MENVNADLKIKIILKNKGNLFANADISIYANSYGFITLKGFQIWKSNVFNNRLNDNINIQPAGKIAFGHFYKQVFFEEKEKWYELEMEIYQEYLKVVNNKKNFNEETVNPEDIQI